MTILLVTVGGVVGVVARYALGTAVSAAALPWMTVAINVTGSFLLGLLATLGADMAPPTRTALALGLLGGFTTFSTFSLDVVKQMEAGDGGRALLNVVLSVFGGVGAAAAGVYAGRALA